MHAPPLLDPWSFPTLTMTPLHPGAGPGTDSHPVTRVVTTPPQPAPVSAFSTGPHGADASVHQGPSHCTTLAQQPSPSQQASILHPRNCDLTQSRLAETVSGLDPGHITVPLTSCGPHPESLGAGDRVQSSADDPSTFQRDSFPS